MPKGKDMTEAVRNRWATELKVESKDPMQQIQQALQPAQTYEVVQTNTPTDRQTDQHAGTQASMPVSTHPRTHTQNKEELLVEALYEQLVNRKRLSSLTFRYQSGELQALEEVFTQLDKKKPRRLSRNDIARLGLIWLIEDYQQHGEESVLAQVHQRM